MAGVNSGGRALVASSAYLSSENLLSIADEFIAAVGAGVVLARPWALAAAAAAAQGKIAGVGCHRTQEESVAALHRTIVELRPLNRGNKEFAVIVAEVAQRWAER